VHQPLFIAHRLIEAGQLEPVLTDYRWSDLDAWVIYPSSRRLPQRLRALIDHLAATFGERPYWEDCLAMNQPAR
jgi:DNA-binding transcriptional LysR family regulator